LEFLAVASKTNPSPSNPIVTIGVCVRNCAAIIKDTIDSLNHQDFPHELFEVIFVDDGSEDATLSVINELIPEMQMQKKVFHHDWKGLGISRNTVVSNASGKYIIWVDGDMSLPADFVRKQVDFMESYPDVAIGKGKYDLTTQGSLVSDLENMQCAKANLRKKGKAGSIPLGTGGSIYRVEAIRQVGGFDASIIGVGEDMDAEQRISAAGWMLDVTPAVFREKRRSSWHSLWQEYFWYGGGNSYLLQKHKESFDQKKLLIPLSLMAEVSRMIVAYKVTGRKTAFLLPLHYVFKRTAWVLGFVTNFLGKS
jgi:glycosyltransferase involved in cell wall biosynthesis